LFGLGEVNLSGVFEKKFEKIFLSWEKEKATYPDKGIRGLLI